MMLENVKVALLRRKGMDDLGLRQAYKRVRKNNIGYTLVELLTVLTIILVLTTFGVFVYNRAIAYAKGTVCQTNLRALEAAIELYTMETDALPASLGRLKLEYIEKGYARAMGDRGWLKKLSFFLVKLDTSDEVYAQFLTPENLKTYGGSEGVFHCPADHNGGASYGINGNLIGRQWSKIGRDELVIGDSDHYVFTSINQLAKRHRHKAFAINKGSLLLELDQEDEVANSIGGDGSSKGGGKGGGDGSSKGGGKGGGDGSSKGGGKGGGDDDSGS
jgi:type II secretory pathway pseudopilin PulG